MDPNNPEIQNYLGVTLSHKGLRVQAETALRKAIQINPLYAPAHNNLAVVYLNQTPPMPHARPLALPEGHCRRPAPQSRPGKAARRQRRPLRCAPIGLGFWINGWVD